MYKLDFLSEEEKESQRTRNLYFKTDKWSSPKRQNQIQLNFLFTNKNFKNLLKTLALSKEIFLFVCYFTV